MEVEKELFRQLVALVEDLSEELESGLDHAEDLILVAAQERLKEEDDGKVLRPRKPPL